MNTKIIFDVEIYKRFNADLASLSDAEAAEHFFKSQHEARIYGNTNTTSEAISMRWLRGSGIEFGAGAYPTKLFGNAHTIDADSDSRLLFRGTNVDKILSVDLSDFTDYKNKYDFSIASHVLEHADSFLKALQNLIQITKNGGYIYLVLPDKRCLHDHLWMPEYDFSHHQDEFNEPLIYSQEHDLLVINEFQRNFQNNDSIHANIPEELTEGLKNGVLIQDYRFLFHKHNYDFESWTNLIFQSKKFLENEFSIQEIRYGHERKDCHFLLQVNK